MARPAPGCAAADDGGLLVAGGMAGDCRARGGHQPHCRRPPWPRRPGDPSALSQIHLAMGYAVVAAGLALCGLGTEASIGAAMDAVMVAAGGGEAGTRRPGQQRTAQYRRGDHRRRSRQRAVAGHGPPSALLSPPCPPAMPPSRGLQSTRPCRSPAAAISAARSLRAAAGTAFLTPGMSSVMLICAAVAVAAILTSLRYLPGRAAPGAAPSAQSPATAAPRSGRTPWTRPSHVSLDESLSPSSRVS